MTVSVSLQADLATIPDAVNIHARTVVAIPPSSVEPIWDEMRVDIAGRIISRAFDPGAAIVTGAPVSFVTEAGDTLITESGETLILELTT